MRYTFAGCCLDTGSFAFFRDGKQQPIEPQVFDLLRVLAENAGQLVSRDHLIETVWGGRIVSDATIATRINAARAAVGDNGKTQKVIRTVPRRGIELVVPVEIGSQDALPLAKSALPQTIRYARSADGTQIAYATSGDGPPLLRAAHQSTHLELEWSSPLWRPTFDALGAQHRLIRFDIRGAGLSDDRLADLDIERHVEDLGAVADAAGAGRFSILASNSGAAPAIRFAARHPDRVGRLVIQQGYVRGRALRGAEAGDDPFVMLRRGGVWDNPDSGYMRAFIAMIAPGLDHAQATDLIRIMTESSGPEAFLANRRVFDVCDSQSFLPEVRAPTLVIHARHDTLNPLPEGRIIAAGIPGAEFLAIDSANTLLLSVDPTWRLQMNAVLSFLAAP